MVSMEFFIDIILTALGLTQPLNKNEYHEYFLGIMAASTYG
jgi:hypothetical protein